MDSTGQILCLLIATAHNDVVFQRFYERFGEQEKADIRRAFQTTQEHLAADRPEALGRFRSAVNAARWEGDLAYHALGAGGCDELAVMELLRFIPSALHDVLKRPPTEAALLEHHARVSIVLSEIVSEGHVDVCDRTSLLRALKVKGFD